MPRGHPATLTNAGKGRPKGSVNKTTMHAKEAIAKAFDKLGGLDALVAWANTDDDTRKVFYGTIYPKLLPLQVAGDADNPIRQVLKIELTGATR